MIFTNSYNDYSYIEPEIYFAEYTNIPLFKEELSINESGILLVQELNHGNYILKCYSKINENY